MQIVGSNPASASNFINEDLLSNTDLANVDLNFTSMDTSNKIDINNLSSASDSPIQTTHKTVNNNDSYLGTTIFDDNNDTKNNNNSINIENAHNLTNDLTSDSNNTNNITTSDVNLSDTIEPNSEAINDKAENI